MCAILMSGLSQNALAQEADQESVLFVGGIRQEWPEAVPEPEDLPYLWRRRLVDTFRSRGYFNARIDSVDDRAQVYLTPGPLAVVNAMHVTVPDTAMGWSNSEIHSARGDTMTDRRIRALIVGALSRFSSHGYLMAEGRLDSVMAAGPESEGESPVTETDDAVFYDVYVSIRPGPVIQLSDIELNGDDQTSERIVAYLAGLETGQRAGMVNLEDVRVRLRGSGLFRQVGQPEYHILPDSTARLTIPVVPSPPGSFDIVLGLLPGSDVGENVQLVGSGSIELNNAFGAGRDFDLKLDRRPGQVSQIDVEVSDPFVAALPIRVAAGFDGLQEDSTYSRRALSASLAYRFGHSLDDLEIGMRYSREVTRPGQAGIRLASGRQRIARSNESFWGVDVRLARLDDPLAPRSGIQMSSIFERGRRSSTRRAVNSAGDTLRTARSDQRERMSFRVRGYFSITEFVSVALGVDGSLLSADDVDESDLYRLGGASSLRGYDEDRFRGTKIGRGLVEIRSWFEQRSYAYVFLDAGYVDRPEMRDIAATTGWHPGFGLGLQLETALGVMNVSYAINDDDGLANGRIHVGLRFGL